MRHFTFSLLLVLSLLAVPGSVLASEPGEAEEASPSTAESPAPGLEPVDALGRPFPDPEILLRARRWTIAGATITVAGVSTMMAGMLLGSAALRGQISVPTEGMYVFAGLLIGGPVLLVAGLPLLSAGNFTRGQLTRKIKGVPKVPRTVANEWAYWRAYSLRLFGQSAVIAGGAAVMMGVLGLVAAGFSAESEYYRPEIWAFPASAFSSGAGLIIGGLLLQKSSRAKMEQIRDDVDPFRRSPSESGSAAPSIRRGPAAALALLPLPGISVASDRHGGLVPRASVSWYLRF